MKAQTQFPVLDVTCGSRMAWYDKNDPRALFCDNRALETRLCDGRTLIIQPDMIEDFTNLSFDDETFYLVFFDPPHLRKVGSTSWLAQKYGKLRSDWEEDLRKGFAEAFRVLKPHGVLIFKWSDRDVPLGDVLKLTAEKPLFGQRSGAKGNAIWTVFMKSLK